jgi:hypothetical protein
MLEGDYAVILDRARVVFGKKVPNEIISKIIGEIDNSIEGVVCSFTEHGLFKEISIATKFGEKWNFWDDKLPRIKKIVEKYLG